jgi:hypothetical protein
LLSPGWVAMSAPLACSVSLDRHEQSRPHGPPPQARGEDGRSTAGSPVQPSIARALLVPSLMGLFGEWSWRAPAQLKRIQRRYRFQGA